MSLPRASRVAALMPKSLLFILAALSLLFAALVLGREQAPRGCEPHAIVSDGRDATAHVRCVPHARIHRVRHECPTIDDDDEYDDDADVETAMLAPHRSQRPRRRL